MSNNTLLIVGASSALGMEIIRQIAAEDSVIFAHCHTGIDRLNRLSSDIAGRLIPIQADLQQAHDIASLIASVNSYAAPPGGIVFLAAPRLTLVRFKDLSLQDFRRHLGMQLDTAVEILKTFLPTMANNGYGRVVFMLSEVTVGLPPANMVHYITAKFALLGLMKALAGEYASRHVCINAVSPAMMETDFLAEIPAKIVELTAQQHPLKRNATPADVAPIVKFLLSEEAGFITGVNIPVTGGGR